MTKTLTGKIVLTKGDRLKKLELDVDYSLSQIFADSHYDGGVNFDLRTEDGTRHFYHLAPVPYFVEEEPYDANEERK